MRVATKDAARYLARYVDRYRKEYGRFSSTPPQGGGYPPLLISPYLDAPELTCYLASNGAAIADYSYQPPYQWEIAGGPTLLVDYAQPKTRPEVVDLLIAQGVWGKPMGIYRLVAQEKLASEVWTGTLGQPFETVRELSWWHSN